MAQKLTSYRRAALMYLKMNRQAHMGYQKSRNDVNMKLLSSTTNLVKSDNSGKTSNRNNYYKKLLRNSYEIINTISLRLFPFTLNVSQSQFK